MTNRELIAKLVDKIENNELVQNEEMDVVLRVKNIVDGKLDKYQYHYFCNFALNYSKMIEEVNYNLNQYRLAKQLGNIHEIRSILEKLLDV